MSGVDTPIDPRAPEGLAVDLRRVSIAHGGPPVVHEFDLEVGRSETVALLGPSGAGKSSLLAAIAGFLRPAGGEIRIGGRLVDGPRRSVPPEARSVGVVFQNDALWPHLTALETVAYPIRRRGVGRDEARRGAAALLDRLGIGALAHRRPAELSGGEQQRTGLARALARQAAVYLLDEPTAHLDTALKATLQREMAEQCRDLGAAVIYATHDVAEALAVADRVAIVRDGRRIQLGTPLEVYERPADEWSARLTGVASVVRAANDGSLAADGDARVLLRPDWVGLAGDLTARVAAVWFRGSHTDVDLTTPYGAVTARIPGPPAVRAGEDVAWHVIRTWRLPDEPEGAR